jgi:hypothetical protein
MKVLTRSSASPGIDNEPDSQHLLPLSPDMPATDAIRTLQINALAAHQHSMGRGDQLVQILQGTIKQLERSHSRVQNMSTILFLAGLVVLGVGVYGTIAGGGEVWSALLGTAGGITSLAAVFWTAPLDRVSASVTDLVKLEAAFLGYIRVIGEIDSYFQMQYLDIIKNVNGDAKASLPQAIRETTAQMQSMMKTTVELIDEHVVAAKDATPELRKDVEDLGARIGVLEGRLGS